MTPKSRTVVFALLVMVIAAVSFVIYKSPTKNMPGQEDVVKDMYLVNYAKHFLRTHNLGNYIIPTPVSNTGPVIIKNLEIYMNPRPNPFGAKVMVVPRKYIDPSRVSTRGRITRSFTIRKSPYIFPSKSIHVYGYWKPYTITYTIKK